MNTLTNHDQFERLDEFDQAVLEAGRDYLAASNFVAAAQHRLEVVAEGGDTELINAAEAHLEECLKLQRSAKRALIHARTRQEDKISVVGTR